MSSITISNTRQIRFDNELAKPSPERPRVDGLVYPRVAQIKGESNRQASFDLYWKLDCLSTAGSVADAGVAKVAAPASPPRTPRMSFVREMAPKLTPKMPSTPLSNLLHSGKAANVLCTPPLLCSSSLSSDSRSLDGASYYSQSCSSSDSD